MNAKTLPFALALVASSAVAIPAMAQDSFGYDTLSKCCWNGVQPLGAVREAADGTLGVVHVGYLYDDASSTGVELIGGDLDRGLVYDFDWTVEPADVSTTMADAVASSDTTDMVGIIIQESDGDLNLQPLGVPSSESGGYVDIGPITVAEYDGGIELAAPSNDPVSQCCITMPESLKAATLDREGYVDLMDAGAITIDSRGSLLEGTTYGR
jgi:hypothetical protein